jgi:hypothetical protein
MTLRERYMVLGDEDETKAAVRMAADLMVDDPETFKRGYSRKNAINAACEFFPKAVCENVEEVVTHNE